MTTAEAREMLRAADDEEPATLPKSVLGSLTINDVPEGVSIQVGIVKDNIHQIDWEGRIHRDRDVSKGEAEYIWTRKYWHSPLGMEQYLDLVRRAVETRHRVYRDVELGHWDDDGAYIQFTYAIMTGEANLGRAFEVVQDVTERVQETADRAADEVGQRVAEVAARLSGWGEDTLDQLVDRVDAAESTDDKGRSLEELCSRLFATVEGFTVTGRIRTATEEIDISVVNDSEEPRLRRESALIIAECKNWSGKCGKDEFVVFREKVENRTRRSSLGVLISWNGFTGAVTKEMLRGSREDTLIVPMTGGDIREAVRSRDFTATVLRCWDAAVAL